MVMARSSRRSYALAEPRTRVGRASTTPQAARRARAERLTSVGNHRRKEFVAERQQQRAMAGGARIGLMAIFAAFFRLGVTSFGGGTAAWLYRAIVQRRHWVDDQAYLVDVGLSRVLPGSAGVNLTVQVGQRLRGGWGALAAVFGLLSGPLFIVVGLAAGFARIAGSPVAHAFLDGVAGAAIGLTFATGLVLVPRGRTEIGQIMITIATVVAIGVLRWPMLPVILCLAPVGIGLALVQRPGRG
jgi:chromate transporter